MAEVDSIQYEPETVRDAASALHAWMAESPPGRGVLFLDGHSITLYGEPDPDRHCPCCDKPYHFRLQLAGSVGEDEILGEVRRLAAEAEAGADKHHHN
jgi:hypothetical protein